MPLLTDLIGYTLSWLPHQQYAQHLLDRTNRTQYAVTYTVLQRRLHYLLYVLHPHVVMHEGVIQLVPTNYTHPQQYQYNNVLSLYLFVLGYLGIPALIRESLDISVRACYEAGTVVARCAGQMPRVQCHALEFQSYIQRALWRCRIPLQSREYYIAHPVVHVGMLDGVELTEREAMALADAYECQILMACMLPHPRVVERVLRTRTDIGTIRGDYHHGQGITRWPPERLYPTILVILRLCGQPASLLYSDLFSGCWEYIAHNSHLCGGKWCTFSRHIGGILYNYSPVCGIAEILRHMHAENWSMHWWGQFIGYHSLRDREPATDIFDFPIPAHVAWQQTRHWGSDHHVSQFIAQWARAARVQYYPDDATLPKNGDRRAWR